MKKELLKTVLPYGIAIVLLFIGSFYDYQITNALHGRLPYSGVFFERLILIPLQSMVIVTFAMLYLVKRKYRYLFCAMIASIYVVQDALHYWMRIDALWLYGILLILAVLYLFTILLLLSQMDQHLLQQRLPFFIFFTCVMLSAAACTTIIKHFWGRIRYRDLTNAQDFIKWYLPQGVTGNRSFPSGHTSGFTSILCFLEWRKNRYEKPSIVRTIIIWMLIIYMPISRMAMGAHFLSDTAVGFLMTYSWYLFYRRYYRRREVL